MYVWRKFVLFYLGGCIYSGLELLWRGWTHGSMFILGGGCFLLLGLLGRWPVSLPLRAFIGALAVTAMELGCGLLVNRRYQVWDYRRMPLNFQGQICLPFTALWVVISMVAFFLYDKLDARLERIVY